MKRVNAVLFAVILFTNIHQCLAQSGGKLLLDAYKKHSAEQLKQFFEQWHSNIPEIGDEEFSKLPDVEKQAYKAFAVFYRPLNIDQLGGSEFGNQIYSKASYLIIQNVLDIYKADKVFYTPDEIDSIVVKAVNNSKRSDSSKREMLKRIDGHVSAFAIELYGPESRMQPHHQEKEYDTIKNFRPKLNIQDKKALYLNKKYDTIVNAFLGNTHLPLGAGDIMNPARSEGESQKRQAFLEQYIKIFYGHWGGYWQLYSYPTVTSITFDKKMEYAKITFTIVYEGGEAILKNEDGNWKVISSKRTWIE